MDFGIFGFSPEEVQQFRSFVAQQQAQTMANANRATGPEAGDSSGAAGQQQHQQRDNNGSTNGNEQRQQQDEPVLMHNAQHAGVVCDNCNTEIRGFRYKCMQCPDFDLCSKCEHKGHHAGHIMMRISFPEQARDAIRRYLNNGNCPPSPPHGPQGHAPEPFPFLRRASGPCHRRGGHGHHGGHGHSHGHHGTPGGEPDRPATAPGCPYDMGKKDFKKWSKWMKKAAAHQHRSAEAYARAAAASGTGNNATGTSASAEAGPECPVDFAAVASQIQEFLNYWGIPVDVVELYDQFGNGGRGAESTNATTTQATGQQENSEQQQQTQQTPTPAPHAEGATANGGNSGVQEQQPASPASVALSDNMQQMRIDDAGNDRAAGESLLMDMDADNAGWTIVDNSREQTPVASITVADAVQPTSLTSPILAVAEPNGNAESSNASSGSLNSNNGSGSVRFASAGSNASSDSAPTIKTPSAPAFPSGIPIPSIPLYPTLNLNPPQIQQILQGVSSAVNSVVRSIPIVTDPRGPVGTNVTTASGGQVPSTGVNVPSSGQMPVELDARSMKTLNQLLAMGFSNEGGYLTRLVSAKNGDLEAVLSSLFPN